MAGKAGIDNPVLEFSDIDKTDGRPARLRGLDELLNL